MKQIEVAIVGGTGYTGAELVRYLLGHSQVRLTWVTSRAEVGRSLNAFFPHLAGSAGDLKFSSPTDLIPDAVQLVFFATPHGQAMQQVPDLLARGKRVIDLSADFRLRDAELWSQWYGVPHGCPEYLSTAVYGLPEVNRAAIASAQLVANPGCYPTSVALGLMPLVESGLVHLDDIIADCKSGVSGAGRDPKRGNLLCEASENFKAYGVAGHRHWPEICQSIADIAATQTQELKVDTFTSIGLTFVPHLLPMVRGIESSLYAKLNKNGMAMSHKEIHALYQERYAVEPFVQVVDLGEHVDTASVKGQNLCRLATFKQQNGRIVVLSVIDNLVKGAAGQAIQNMNILFGWPETQGLMGQPHWP